MSFRGRNNPTNPLFKTLEIMKLKDILLYNNCVFAHNQRHENLPETSTISFKQQQTKIIIIPEVPQIQLLQKLQLTQQHMV